MQDARMPLAVEKFPSVPKEFNPLIQSLDFEPFLFISSNHKWVGTTWIESRSFAAIFCWFCAMKSVQWVIQVRVPHCRARFACTTECRARLHLLFWCFVLTYAIEVNEGYSLNPLVSVLSLLSARAYSTLHGWRCYWLWRIGERYLMWLLLRMTAWLWLHDECTCNSSIMAINRCKEYNMFSIYLHWPLNDVQTDINSIRHHSRCTQCWRSSGPLNGWLDDVQFFSFFAQFPLNSFSSSSSYVTHNERVDFSLPNSHISHSKQNANAQ